MADAIGQDDILRRTLNIGGRQIDPNGITLCHIGAKGDEIGLRTLPIVVLGAYGLGLKQA